MDRDRRGDGYDPDVTHLGRGESYRPGGGVNAPPYRPSLGRDRPSGDKWISDRRDSDRREDIDSYVPLTSRRAERLRSRSPGGYRRRSRSPIHRERDETYSSRPRSPLRRFSPRRNDRPVSPSRRRSRSPYGARPFSPRMKRARDDSPAYPRRSPLPAKRERLSSPDGRSYDRPYDRPRSPLRRPYSPPPRDMGPRGYRKRSRTPPNRERRSKVYNDDNWRHRSPSPRAAPSGPASGTTSRRSSPPIHPDRLSLAGSRPRSPGPRSYDSRPPGSPRSRPRSLARRERSPLRQQSPPRSYVDRTRPPPSPRQDYRRSDEAPSSNHPPTGPGAYRNGNYNRPPPSGPSRSYGEASQMSPPAGPSNSSLSMSAHNRPNPAILSAPTRPRGAPPGRFDGPPRDFSAPSPRRGAYGGPSLRSTNYDVRDGPRPAHRGGFGRGGYGRGDAVYGRGDSGYARGEAGYGRGDPGYARGEAAYGRGDSGYPSHRPSFEREDGPPSFRSQNNSSSSTYPRTQRFNTTSQHLAGGDKIIPGGKLAPTGMSPEQEKRIKLLEEAAEKMREEIEEKQRTKREALREWDVRQRESEREGLRSELAERHLEKLTEGEDGAGAAF